MHIFLAKRPKTKYGSFSPIYEKSVLKNLPLYKKQHQITFEFGVEGYH